MISLYSPRASSVHKIAGFEKELRFSFTPLYGSHDRHGRSRDILLSCHTLFAILNIQRQEEQDEFGRMQRLPTPSSRSIRPGVVTDNFFFLSFPVFDRGAHVFATYTIFCFIRINFCIFCFLASQWQPCQISSLLDFTHKYSMRLLHSSGPRGHDF
jgi:hypothetical protein